ncbi:hypothetical protein KIPB_016769, partial [Kipferlia bialata]
RLFSDSDRRHDGRVWFGRD